MSEIRVVDSFPQLYTPENAMSILNTDLPGLDNMTMSGAVIRYRLGPRTVRYEIVRRLYAVPDEAEEHGAGKSNPALEFRGFQSGHTGRREVADHIRCGTCKEVKPADDFAIRYRDTGERATICRSCKTTYNKAWYQRNKARHLEHVKANDQRYLAAARAARALLPPKPKKPPRTYAERADYLRPYNRKWVAARRAEFFAGKVCLDCGSTEKLEIHHRDPTLKVANSIWTWAKERKEAELAKCDVVCNACHKRRHGIVPGGRHGGKHRYESGCRCELCVVGQRERRKARRERA